VAVVVETKTLMVHTGIIITREATDLRITELLTLQKKVEDILKLTRFPCLHMNIIAYI